MLNKHHEKLADMFETHYKRKSGANAVEKDLKRLLQTYSVTKLATMIFDLHIHIGTWKRFKSRSKLRHALRINGKYKRFPLKKAKSLKVIKACLLKIHFFNR